MNTGALFVYEGFTVSGVYLKNQDYLCEKDRVEMEKMKIKKSQFALRLKDFVKRVS